MVIRIAVPTHWRCEVLLLFGGGLSLSVAFGSGEVSIKQMVKVGVWLNLIALVVVMATVYTLVPLVFGVTP